MKGERLRVNLLSLVVTVGMLFVAVKVSDGSFATRISFISQNLDRRLMELLDTKSINFTNFTNNAVYVSNKDFNPRGMAGLYNLTNAFMDAVMSKDFYPEGFLSVRDNNLQIGNIEEQWQSLLLRYGGLLALIIIVLLLIVFMPFCGLCFCCCRCCGKCGARSQPFDKKHDLCKKIILATLLICLGTLLLFGVVCAFVSNQQMKEGVDELPNNLRNGIDDINTYLNTTKREIDVVLVTNYREFETVLLETMDESGDLVYGQLILFTNAITMTDIQTMVNSLPNIQIDFETLKFSNNALRVYGSQLSDAVRKVKKDLLATLNLPECERIRGCSTIRQNVSDLQTNMHFSNLPDLTKQIEMINGFKELNSTIQPGLTKLHNIEEIIGRTVNETLNKAKGEIGRAATSIDTSRKEVQDVVINLQKQINDVTRPHIETAEDYLTKYSIYRYYAFLAISCTLLLISILVALGLICGICGKRPDVYGDDCCNKGAGSQFLICGVMLMFLSGFVIAVVVLVGFVVGILSQRVVCDSFRDPSNSQIFALLNQMNFSQYQIDFNISDALVDCKKNKSIYETFRLEKQFNLTEIKNKMDEFNISSISSGLSFDNDIFDNFQLITSDMEEQLRELADSGLDLDLSEFNESLAHDFTNANLSAVADELRNLLSQVPASANPDFLGQIRNSIMNLDTYQTRIVEPMMKNATAVVVLAAHLQIKLKFGHENLAGAIDSMISELKGAEEQVKTNGTEDLTRIAANFTTALGDQIQMYLNRVVDLTSTEVGQCGPLSLVIDATLTSTCDKIILPWNGYWFGLFWSLLVFIPTIIISVKLATLYQKYSPYAGQSMEAEYLYDAYADRESFPLNSRNNKSKKKNKKYKRYEDRPIASGGGGDMVTRDYAGGSHHQDARYADMAPKQWEDFPAGGPPQYQRAPTEYERPPPYYYPGASENSQ